MVGAGRSGATVGCRLESASFSGAAVVAYGCQCCWAHTQPARFVLEIIYCVCKEWACQNGVPSCAPSCAPSYCALSTGGCVRNLEFRRRIEVRGGRRMASDTVSCGGRVGAMQKRRWLRLVPLMWRYRQHCLKLYFVADSNSTKLIFFSFKFACSDCPIIRKILRPFPCKKNQSAAVIIWSITVSRPSWNRFTFLKFLCWDKQTGTKKSARPCVFSFFVPVCWCKKIKKM